MKDRFKEILKEEGISGKDFCELLGGLSYGSYRSLTMPSNKSCPKWVRSFVMAYELKSNLKQ